MTHDELRRLAEAATKGPWAAWTDQDGAPHMNHLLMVGNAAALIPEGQSWVEDVDINPVAHTYLEEDRQFIAAANPATVLALIERAEKAEREPPTGWTETVEAQCQMPWGWTDTSAEWVASYRQPGDYPARTRRVWSEPWRDTDE